MKTINYKAAKIPLLIILGVARSAGVVSGVGGY